jgi:hypothetical protein
MISALRCSATHNLLKKKFIAVSRDLHNDFFTLRTRRFAPKQIQSTIQLGDANESFATRFAGFQPQPVFGLQLFGRRSDDCTANPHQDGLDHPHGEPQLGPD